MLPHIPPPKFSSKKSSRFLFDIRRPSVGRVRSFHRCFGSQRGFTLIEVVVVFGIIGALLLLLGKSTGSFQIWRDEAFIRNLRERLEFLHYRSLSDQIYYQMEISLDRKQYRIGVLRPDDVVNTNVQASNDDGQLTTELNDFLNPSLATAGNLIPPPSFPSLAEWVFLPYGGVINSVRTRDRFVTPDRGQSIFLVFHPNGFSEFAVFHLTLASRGAVTLVINPFTGRTKLYQGHKEFRWSYGK